MHDQAIISTYSKNWKSRLFEKFSNLDESFTLRLRISKIITFYRGNKHCTSTCTCCGSVKLIHLFMLIVWFVLCYCNISHLHFDTKNIIILHSFVVLTCFTATIVVEPNKKWLFIVQTYFRKWSFEACNVTSGNFWS